MVLGTAPNTSNVHNFNTTDTTTLLYCCRDSVSQSVSLSVNQSDIINVAKIPTVVIFIGCAVVQHCYNGVHGYCYYEVHGSVVITVCSYNSKSGKDL